MDDKVPVIQYTMKGIYVNEYKSMTEAHNTGISIPGISQACRGEIQTSAGGFRWIYSNMNKIKKHRAGRRTLPVIQYNMIGKVMGTYSSISEASKVVNLHPIAISKMCRGIIGSRMGHYFRFLNTKDKFLTYTKMRSVNQLGLQGEIIATFRSSNTAAKILGISCHRILTACRKLSTINGYRFEFVS